ncbi:hypothetical protein [Aeromonas caviae]|uniref:hypothetical protein n=1 Tax=Aeromonas caviae TaxID=648 RepID=UPI0038CFA96C
MSFSDHLLAVEPTIEVISCTESLIGAAFVASCIDKEAERTTVKAGDEGLDAVNPNPAPLRVEGPYQLALDHLFRNAGDMFAMSNNGPHPNLFPFFYVCVELSCIQLKTFASLSRSGKRGLAPPPLFT